MKTKQILMGAAAAAMIAGAAHADTGNARADEFAQQLGCFGIHA